MSNLLNRVVYVISQVFNGLAVIGFTYVVTHDITLQDIASWLR